MPNELVPQDVGGGDLSNFEEMTASDVEFLSRIQLYGGKSNAVAEGKIPANHYGIPVDDDIIDLGDKVDVAILAWRPKALHTGEEPIVESFDPTSDLFKRIKMESGVKDSGAMYGPEFLLYVPDVNKYVTFFMSSKTARREARKMEPLLRCAATLKSKTIKAGKYIWQGPVVIECSTPLTMPDLDEIKAKVEQFKNPPVKEVELAEEDDRER